MVEHSAVNRVVVGSSPTRGAKPAADAAVTKPIDANVYRLFCVRKRTEQNQKENKYL